MSTSLASGSAQGHRPLQWLNFFMADVQAGIGPFLGIFLLSHGWKSGLIGTVMTIGGVAGMLVTTPAGALVDATRKKKTYVILPALFTVLASGLILLSQQFWLVTASQIATAVAGSAIMPAVIGITLGIVKQKGFNRQNGLNQAYNHGGNVVGAALSGYLGYKFGIAAVLILSAVFAIFAIGCALLIPGKDIDDNAARGLTATREDGDKPHGLKILMSSKPLLVLAVALLFFHLGNAAMLPLYGLAGAVNGKGDPSVFVAMTIVIAQVTMIFTSIFAYRFAESKGYWLIMLISFLSLPLRGFIAAHFISQSGIFPVQILDGIGAGLQSVAVPALVAKILNGTGRINIGQGAVLTMQNVGAALSPAIGGWLAETNGYPSAFLLLGGSSVVSVIAWTLYAKPLKLVC